MSQSKRISFKKPTSMSKTENKNNQSSYPSWGSVNDLRGSKSLESTGLLEAEYIKSLQQQIYLLELENNHLRQQTLKAAEMQPKMTHEAEQMLDNLKNLQNKVESLELELFRKEGHVDLLNSKIQHLTKKLDQETNKHGRERTLILGESLNTRQDLEQMERELSRKNILVDELKDDVQRNASNLQAAENKVELLRAQLQQEMTKSRSVELELANKKSELINVDVKLRELETRYVSNNNSYHEAAKKELKQEIQYLQEKLDKTRGDLENEQQLRHQMSDDAAKLLKDNAHLNRQIIDLQNSLEKERSVREKIDQRRFTDSGEYERLRNKEKEMESRMRKIQVDLEEEKSRTARLMSEIAQQEKVYNRRINEDGVNRKRISETDAKSTSILHENEKLRQDKENLIEHIENLQDELQKKTRSIDENNRLMEEMDHRLQQLENLKDLDDTIQSKRWDELEHTIDALKSQASVMASITKPKSSARKSIDHLNSSNNNRGSPYKKGSSASLARHKIDSSPVYTS